MPETGEKAKVAVAKKANPTFVLAVITEITFKSGIKLFTVDKAEKELEVPAAGTPHWSGGEVFPAAYVRQGGVGETNDLDVKVTWYQAGHDGAAKLRGRSPKGDIEIEGDLTLSGERGEAIVACKMTRKPDVVRNYGSRGAGGDASVNVTFQIEAGGVTRRASGPPDLRLFFLDAKPKPFPVSLHWPYKAHYLRVVEWAADWADGKQGSAAVFDALWSRFSDGTGARVPHATALEYWKTNDPVQDLKAVVTQNLDATKRGWSCRAIAHLFMETLALHGIQSQEVKPEAPKGSAFLVKNWDKRATPIPNYPSAPDLYYGGSWVPISTAPLQRAVPTSFERLPATPLEIDMTKRPGVPAQGQSRAPLQFGNHWIVARGGRLYDTSYGAVCVEDMTVYRDAGMAGWLVAMDPDTFEEDVAGKKVKKKSFAWFCREVTYLALVRVDGSHN